MTQIHIPVYVTEEEKEMIKTACKSVGLNQSSFIRNLALKEVRKLRMEEENAKT